jgi:hypothetical protein
VLVSTECDKARINKQAPRLELKLAPLIHFEFSYIIRDVRREVLYNILIEFGVPMKLVRLIKMCLNETYSKVRVGKHLSDNFPIQNGLKQGDALFPLIFKFTLEYAIRNVEEIQLG